MKWSRKIGEIAGIGIYVHATFLILLGWVALSYYLAGQSNVGEFLMIQSALREARVSK